MPVDVDVYVKVLNTLTYFARKDVVGKVEVFMSRNNGLEPQSPTSINPHRARAKEFGTPRMDNR